MVCYSEEKSCLLYSKLIVCIKIYNYTWIFQWISQTILERLEKEIDAVDAALARQSISDVRVGHVGLERLRKTARTLTVVQNIPTLPNLVPFLELSPHQEYVVSRLRGKSFKIWELVFLALLSFGIYELVLLIPLLQNLPKVVVWVSFVGIVVEVSMGSLGMRTFQLMLWYAMII